MIGEMLVLCVDHASGSSERGRGSWAERLSSEIWKSVIYSVVDLTG